MANIKSAKKRILVNSTRLQETKQSVLQLRLPSRKLRQQLRIRIRQLQRLLLRTQSPQSAKLHPRAFITKITAPEKFPVFPKLSTALRNRPRNILVISL